MKKTAILLLALILATNALAFEFCDDGTVGEDKIRIISVDDMLKENQKEWQWESTQNIELEIRVENKNDKQETYILEAIFKDNEKTVKIATDSDDLKKEFSLDAKERKSVSLEFETEEDLDPETHSLYVKLYKKNNENEECVENSEEKTEIIKIQICEDDNVDEDELEITNIKDQTNDNKEEWIWAPQDNIKLTTEFENKYYSERDFNIELVFLDENNKEVSIATNPDDIVKTKNLNEDESEDATFDFKVNPNIKEGKYKVYAKLYDSENPSICTSLKAQTKSNPILTKIEKEERKVIVTKVEGPTNLSTSSVAQYQATLENLGSKDEEKVQAVLYNYKLNLKQKIPIDDLQSGEEKTITFDISIPKNASAEKYALLFSTEYEYSDSQDFYKSESNENDDIKYQITIYEIPEEETQEELASPQEENQTTQEENQTTPSEENQTQIQENQTPSTQMTITGNAIGTNDNSPNWIIIIALLILAGIGVVFFLKKIKNKEDNNIIIEPKIARRYKAKL